MYFGIIGNGFIAQKHKEAGLKMGWDYIGAYDIIPSKSDLELKDLDKADIISICTPNAFHVPYMKLFKDKKLIVEKPISVDMDIPDIDACVCYQRRFDTQAIEMKKWCEIPPKYMSVNILVPRDNFYWECWRGDPNISGGGALMNIGIHYIDLLQWWLGDGEVLESKIGYFNRVMDESAYAKLKFGETEVDFHINARHNVRKIEFIAYEKEYFVYNKEDATHYDLFKGWMEGNYVTPKESLKSLKLIKEIYGNNSQTIQK
jgi:predicted dehydrogenase